MKHNMFEAIAWLVWGLIGITCMIFNIVTCEIILAGLCFLSAGLAICNSYLSFKLWKRNKKWLEENKND